MAKLTVEQRRRLTKKAFACPTTRDYPINDPSRVSSAEHIIGEVTRRNVRVERHVYVGLPESSVL